MHALQDDPDFLAYYGFSHDPFAAGGAGFQFFKPKRREVLEQLIHFSRYSQLALLVTGPRGSGKTVLRHALAAGAKATAVNVVVPASRNNDAGGILQLLASVLGNVPADVISALAAIEQQALAGKDVHILIDDAQLLDPSAVQLLQRLAQGNGVARAKVFLFAESSILSMLQALADEGHVLDYHQVELEPWDVDESQQYLQQRLVAAGAGLDVFTDQELNRVLDEAGGWPGALNQQSREALIARINSRNRPAVSQPARPVLPYRHLAALAILAVALVGLWYWGDSPKTDAVGTVAEEVQLAPDVVRQAASAPVVEEPGRPVERIALALPEQVVEKADAPLIRPPQPETAPAVPQQPVSSQLPAGVAVVEKPAVVEPVPVAAPVRQPVPVAQPPAARPEPAPRVEAAVAARQAAVSGQGWYQAQPAAKLTLQVFATSSESKARNFVQTRGGAYRYYRKQHQGQPLYVVTHGLYDDRNAALAAEARLPQELRKNKPWPKSLGSIQQEIR